MSTGGPTNPPSGTIMVDVLRTCQRAAIEWSWANSAPPYKVDVLSAMPININMNLATFSAAAQSAVWPEVGLADGWKIFVRVTNSSENTFIDSEPLTVLPCPPGGVGCGCSALPVPGGSTTSTSSSSSSSSSQPPSSSSSSQPPSSSSSQPPSSSSQPPSSSSQPPSSSTSAPPSSFDPPSSSAPPSSSSTPPPTGVSSVDPSTTTVTKTSSGPGLQTPAPGHKPSSSNTGAIVGGVVGGIAFLAILAALILVCRRRRREKRMEERFEINENAPYVYAPYAYRDGDGDDDEDPMNEVDHPLRPDPYPYIPPSMSGGNLPPTQETGGAYAYPSYMAADWSTTVSEQPHQRSPVTSTFLASNIASPQSLQPQPLPLSAGTDPAPVVPTTSALATATGLARGETKLDAERRRNSHNGKVPGLQGMPVQAEDGGFVADGEQIPPLYRPEWEAEQRRRLGQSAV